MEENYLLAKWLNNEMSESELATFMASEEYAQYEKIKKYSAHLEVADFDEQKVLKNVLKQKKKESKLIFWNTWYAKIAAILVLGLAINFVVKNFATTNQSTNNGEQKTFLLPDNSEVALNSASEINYKKRDWDDNRNLELEGEAYFKVSHGKRFEITTQLGKVAVLGTQFNVKSRKNRLDVTCFEGRVKVNYKDKQIILTKGMAVSFENGNQVNKTTEVSKPEWLSNKMAFDREHLRNILDEIQRQYNVTIKINSTVPDPLFTGEIPSDNLGTALQIIATTYNLKFSKTATNIVLFEKK